MNIIINKSLQLFADYSIIIVMIAFSIILLGIAI